MRNILIGLVAAGTAFAFATPVVAQPYGNTYGYNNNWGQVRSLQARIDAVQRQIRVLDRRNVMRDDRADRLRAEANGIENRLHRAGRNGLNSYEANDINVRIARLEQRIQVAVANRGYGYNGQYADRDHDGRNDRYEDDRGSRRDR